MTRTVFAILQLLGYSNSATNPIVYCFLSENFNRQRLAAISSCFHSNFWPFPPPSHSVFARISSKRNKTLNCLLRSFGGFLTLTFSSFAYSSIPFQLSSLPFRQFFHHFQLFPWHGILSVVKTFPVPVTSSGSRQSGRRRSSSTNASATTKLVCGVVADVALRGPERSHIP